MEEAKFVLSADRSKILANGTDLSFITVRVVDQADVTAPRANDRIEFTIDGPGKIVATDNGDPTDFEPFPSATRNAFNGLALVIVRSKPGTVGTIRLSAKSGALQGASLPLQSVRPEE